MKLRGSAEKGSPAAVKVHVSKQPELKPRGAASHMGIDKAYDKRLRISELAGGRVCQCLSATEKI